MARPTFDQLFRAHWDPVRRYVSHAFPGYCGSTVDDAVAHAFTVLVERPSLLDDAWADGGLSRVVGLLRMLAWRYARGLWRKIALMNWEILPDLSAPGGQEVYVQAQRAFEGALHEAANFAGPTRYAQIRAAVLDKLESGDSDIAVAARHGIPREYVNRAKRQVTAQVLAA